ncbi:MAG: hypothetical protein K2X93_08520 [Candidatus Obscuribacterales bacterium]|nr:hypothetical protein [Candidatus Obscuribacterales bacterium]
MQIVMILFAVAFGCVVLKKLFTEKRFLPLPALMNILVIAAVACSPEPINSVLWFYVPSLFHASQYIALGLAYYLKERSLQLNISCDLGKEFWHWPAIVYLGGAFAIGTFVYLAIPHVFRLYGADYWRVAGLILALANFHQFITDSAIWHLRDKECREKMMA